MRKLGRYRAWDDLACRLGEDHVQLWKNRTTKGTLAQSNIGLYRTLAEASREDHFYGGMGREGSCVRKMSMES